ncbi:MAG: FAD-binding oxidoreductase [Burkholderiales bacterium]|nr:FAD-binding oxidoreductase [Burkholderiales bacterium]
MTAEPSAPLLQALLSRHPELHLLPASAGHDALLPYEQDWRKRYRGQALAVAFPTSTAQIQSIVQLCADFNVSIVPQGGNTSLVGGSVPDCSQSQLVLNLTRMNRIRQIDPANLSITVEAGCTLQQVQDAALDAGLFFPLSLASEGSCTIGGNLATNAGGTQVLRYGTARDLCLGVEAVTATGKIIHALKSLRKDNTGYDIKNLLIGSEGTLGILTQASLRLYPRPRTQQAALLTCPDLACAVKLLAHAQSQLDSALTGFEVMHQDAIRLARQHMSTQARAADALMSTAASAVQPEWLILLDASSPQSAEALQQSIENTIQHAMDQGWVGQAQLSMSHTQYRTMWQLRETIPMAEKIEGLMVKHDIAVPTSAVPAFASRCHAALHQAFPGCRIVCFGHLGDGNLHYNVQGPREMPDDAFLQSHEAEVNRIVYDLVEQYQGTISAEHGIGQLKKLELAERADPARLQWMRLIKQTLDPGNRLNPGRLVD